MKRTIRESVEDIKKRDEEAMRQTMIPYKMVIGFFVMLSILTLLTTKAEAMDVIEGNGYTYTIPQGAKTFVYSGGCFWCSEADSEKLDGVYETISGFTAGTSPSPRYSFGMWGNHREAALVVYDPSKISYVDLVDHVYSTVDYEDAGGQFCDRGHSYSPAIYYKTEAERDTAISLAPETSVVPVEMESTFYPVRPEHQNYWKGAFTQLKYKFYRHRCGRDQRIAELNQ